MLVFSSPLLLIAVIQLRHPPVLLCSPRNRIILHVQGRSDVCSVYLRLLLLLVCKPLGRVQLLALVVCGWDGVGGSPRGGSPKRH